MARKHILLIAVAALIAATLVGTISRTGAVAEESPPKSAVGIPQIARDGTVLPEPPPPGSGYCSELPAGEVFPSLILGTLTIGDMDAPADTLVTVTYDGRAGPSTYTTTPGGYKIFYTVGRPEHDPPCLNAEGTRLGIRVNGIDADLGVIAGDRTIGLVYRFDIALP